MSVSKEKIIQDIVDICHRLYANGFVTATDGNVSVRLENGNFLTTRSSINKGMITVDDFIEVNQKGDIQIANHKSQIGNFKPSTELGMHLFIYSQRPDIHAVVHAHPTYATGFAVARQSLNECVFPEVVVGLGAIPLADYATPSTPEVAASLAPHVKHATAILMENHGVVTYGNDLYDAYFKMEKVEHAAHILYIARMLGGETALSQDQLEKLKAISQSMYGKQIIPENECTPAVPENKNVNPINQDNDILASIRQMMQ